jgi:hypothetical protein
MSAPSAPTLAVVNDGTGTSVTATVGGDAGVTHRLFYRLRSGSAWIAGLTRAGNGTIVQTGLTANSVYLFMAVSDNGEYSLPSPVRSALVQATGVTPAAGFSLPLDNLRDLLADCASFQTWVSALDAESAKADIYLVALSEPVGPKRPFALIAHREPAVLESRAIAGGVGQQFNDNGQVELLFEATVDPADAADHAAAELRFTNAVGAIVDEMKSLAGTNGYVQVRAIGVLRGPARAHPNERDSEGDYYQVQFAVSWGLES